MPEVNRFTWRIPVLFRVDHLNGSLIELTGHCRLVCPRAFECGKTPRRSTNYSTRTTEVYYYYYCPALSSVSPCQTNDYFGGTSLTEDGSNQRNGINHRWKTSLFRVKWPSSDRPHLLIASVESICHLQRKNTPHRMQRGHCSFSL